VLGCVTQCSQSAAHSCEQFLQVQQIGFVTLGRLRHGSSPIWPIMCLVGR